MIAMKLLQPSVELAKKHYLEHEGKDFYERICKSICKGPVVAMVWEGDNVIATGRKLIGKTFNLDRDPGTIRFNNSNST